MGVLGVLAAAAVAAEPAPERQSELRHLLRQDCGSCHGLRLTGGLGPPLTAEALRGKPAAWLEAVVLDGLPGSAMPGWRGLLSDDEAAWLVRRLLEDGGHEP